jgi:hypothetical protein
MQEKKQNLTPSERPAPAYERAALKITVFRTGDVIAASGEEPVLTMTRTLYEGKLRM